VPVKERIVRLQTLVAVEKILDRKRRAGEIFLSGDLLGVKETTRILRVLARKL
jgi:hypothetical protein